MENAHLSKFFVGVNFLTPIVVEYGESENHFYELSKEKGTPSDLGLFGVTVVTKTGSLTDLNKCCHSFGQAQKYISELS